MEVIYLILKDHKGVWCSSLVSKSLACICWDHIWIQVCILAAPFLIQLSAYCLGKRKMTQSHRILHLHGRPGEGF